MGKAADLKTITREVMNDILRDFYGTTAALVIGWDSGAPLNHSRWADKVYGDSHGSLTDVKRVSGFRPVRISAGSQSSPGAPPLPAT
ncbi:hypothetical protein EYF80_054385 [Liparis tanakae]|uniref:Uncharacterized protein n=1 Tax=Liparis tanakae TaxID=230148 RepID=A0A4Z2F322_9TELE|nr:hypothetical protein EYF80_054385 [Liparis tanakae]